MRNFETKSHHFVEYLFVFLSSYGLEYNENMLKHSEFFVSICTANGFWILQKMFTLEYLLEIWSKFSSCLSEAILVYWYINNIHLVVLYINWYWFIVFNTKQVSIFSINLLMIVLCRRVFYFKIIVFINDYEACRYIVIFQCHIWEP